jgi:hypothetical protein
MNFRKKHSFSTWFIDKGENLANDWPAWFSLSVIGCFLFEQFSGSQVALRAILLVKGGYVEVRTSFLKRVSENTYLFSQKQAKTLF